LTSSSRCETQKELDMCHNCVSFVEQQTPAMKTKNKIKFSTIAHVQTYDKIS